MRLRFLIGLLLAFNLYGACIHEGKFNLEAIEEINKNYKVFVWQKNSFKKFSEVKKDLIELETTLSNTGIETASQNPINTIELIFPIMVIASSKAISKLKRHVFKLLAIRFRSLGNHSKTENSTLFFLKILIKTKKLFLCLEDITEMRELRTG